MSQTLTVCSLKTQTCYRVYMVFRHNSKLQISRNKQIKWPINDIKLKISLNLKELVFNNCFLNRVKFWDF